MKFEEILPLFREGKFIRIKSWGPKEFIYIEHHTIYDESGNSKVPNFYAPWLNCDWELYSHNDKNYSFCEIIKLFKKNPKLKVRGSQWSRGEYIRLIDNELYDQRNSEFHFSGFHVFTARWEIVE